MNRDMQVGLALAILLIGVVGAMFFRNHPGPPLKLPGQRDGESTEPSETTPRPLLDSRSDSERPASTLPPRRATGGASQPLTTRVSPPRANRTATRPAVGPSTGTLESSETAPLDHKLRRPAVSRVSSTPPAPAMPVTKAIATGKNSPTLATAGKRQPGSPPRTVHGDVDRPPIILRFSPARHPLTHRRTTRPPE